MYQQTIWQQFKDVQYIEKWIVWVAWLSSKVLEALKAPKTEPFAQNSQYKNAFQCEEEKGDDAGAAGRPKDRKNAKKKKRRRGPAQVKDVKVSTADSETPNLVEYAPGDFAAVKKKCLDGQIQGGSSREEAVNAWNLSDTKKNF